MQRPLTFSPPDALRRMRALLPGRPASPPPWRRHWSFGVLAAAGLATAACMPSSPGPQPQETAAARLIPRAHLLGPPARADAALSPDGAWVAYIAPHLGQPNVFIAPATNIAATRALTMETRAAVADVQWSAQQNTLLYTLRTRPGGRHQLFAINVLDGAGRPLTPEGSDARVLGVSPAEPDAVLVEVRARDRATPEVRRVVLSTGDTTVLERNERGFTGFMADRSNALRLASLTNDSGEVELWVREREGDRSDWRWRRLLQTPFADSRLSAPLGFEASGETFLMLDSAGRDRAALVRVNARTGAKEVLGVSAAADVVDAWINPATGAPEAFGAEYLRRDWRPLNDVAAADLELLEENLEGDFHVTSRTQDNLLWLVEESAPTIPLRTWVYDRRPQATRPLRLLFANYPALQDRPMQPMQPREIVARDGLTLVSYLTLPPGADADNDGRPESPGPLVLLVHRGPWARDSFGFSPMHQWLANRGYAVLSVNFRGSTGIGNAFLNAGNLEWGGRMLADLVDAANWAVAQNIAAPERIALMGHSYGGYATLAGMAFESKVFACGAALSAPVDLSAVITDAPLAWRPFLPDLRNRIGDPRTAEGRRLLRERSPLFAANQIRGAVLLAYGGEDAILSQGGMDQMVAALREADAAATVLRFPRAGHDFEAPAPRQAYFAAAEAFLANCLDGAAEPFGADFEGVEAVSLLGAQRIPGLATLAPPRARASAARPAAGRSAAPTVQEEPAEPVLPAPDEPIRTRRESGRETGPPAN